ncbi:hypothetical protein [Tahibacter amnicola]|uniref:SGNH/GDSL hydrolase family protein n=1 Tax=Tahibacter amnicola TaxID=2976241 RepID=A0ABY6BGL1_9GAMM|nr:hypothetical protein [Tahibacter amnicola]UXI67510.1 hypothetical protein N4264_22675 [Tahibacter amnicola]
MRTLIKFTAPLVLVLLAELAFRAGIWERWAQPDSHAGTSIRVKRALAEPQFAKIDFVTLGSSRPVYGLDHEAIAASATAAGFQHVNMSMPGSHWMAIGAVTEWLARSHPELRGGIIAVDTTSFSAPGNGAYEIGIARPFVGVHGDDWMTQHVPFSWSDTSTWSVHSSLFLYREDMQDLLKAPRARYLGLEWHRQRPGSAVVLSNATEERNLCTYGRPDSAVCTKLGDAADDATRLLVRQCQDIVGAKTYRPDYGQSLRQGTLQPEMIAVRDLVQKRLRGLRWKQKPLVVLMPVTPAWKEAAPVGAHEWALSVLQPLVAEGTIDLIDTTDTLDKADGSDCQDYFDLYHQNAHGRERLMSTLMPQIRERLHSPTANDQVATAATGPARGD